MSMPRSSWGFLAAVAVFAGAAISPPAEAQALSFFNLSPCRAVDTRSSGYGGILVGSSIRSFQMKGVCGVPADAKTVTLNVTAVGPTCGGFFVVYPAGLAIPAV